MHLALNNLQWLICHKTKTDQSFLLSTPPLPPSTLLNTTVFITPVRLTIQILPPNPLSILYSYFCYKTLFNSSVSTSFNPPPTIPFFLLFLDLQSSMYSSSLYFLTYCTPKIFLPSYRPLALWLECFPMVWIRYG